MTLLPLAASVVFIGHSLFGHDNPAMLDQLLDTRGPAKVEAQIINGAPLAFNWEHSASAEGVDARIRLQQPADAVIVTEAVPLANHLKWSNTPDAVTRFYELARAANPDVDFYLQETWHSLKSGTGVPVEHDADAHIPWRERLNRDLPHWQGVVNRVNADTGGSVRLLPAGQAMAALDDAIRAGTVPGLSRIEDVFADDIHPNDTGRYFLSLFQYAVLTGESPAGLPHRLKDRWGRAYQAPSGALAARLQDIAWAAAGTAGKTGNATDRSVQALPPEPGPLPQDPPGIPRLNTRPAAQVPDTETAATALPVPPAIPKQPIAINLAAIADWSPQAPFLDHFKTARPWIGHIAGQWGGAGHADLAAAGYLDPDGWPTAIPPELGSIGTVVLTDLPEAARSLKGRYVLRFSGDGIVEVTGRARNLRYSDGEIRFDFTPGPGAVDIRIQRTDRKGTGDYIRNMSLVKEEHLAAFGAGALFNPLWLDHLRGFAALRFMDWMATNNSAQTGWEDRPQVTDYSWAVKGVPAEILLALAREAEADPWFTLPHMADDTYFRRFARLAARRLPEGRRAYVEYSNEVWNWQFAQAGWADEQARARWGGDSLWMQFYGGRAAEMAQIWTQEFGASAADRLVRVIATQTGWMGLEEQLLTAPLWTAEQAGRKPPAEYFDAYAVTGYFGGVLGLEDRAPMVLDWVAQDASLGFATSQAYAELWDGRISGNPEDTLETLLGTVLPYHAKQAKTHGLDLIMYEGGSHAVGHGAMVDNDALTGFLTHFSYTPEMGALYARLLEGWAGLGGQLFTAFNDVYTPSKWGSWGGLRHLSDTNPRWNALEAAQ